LLIRAWISLFKRRHQGFRLYIDIDLLEEIQIHLQHS